MRSSGTTTTSWPRARNAAAVRSPSGSGRVTSEPHGSHRGEEIGAAALPQLAPGVGAERKRHRRRRPDAHTREPRCRRAWRSARENADGRRDGSVARDRRAAGALEHREEGALAAERGRAVGVIDRRRAGGARLVVRARLERNDPLPDRRQELVDGRMAVAACASSSRFKPAIASRVASTAPSLSLRRRVSTLPRKVTTSRSGRRRLTWACRRSEALPTAAPLGSRAAIRPCG